MNKLNYKILFTVPALLLISGCSIVSGTTSPPPPVKQASTLIELPDNFDNELSKNTNEVEFAEIDTRGWVTHFNSDELESLIDKGLKNNPSLAATATRILDSEILVNISNNARYPNLNLGLTGARAKNNTFGPSTIANNFDLSLNSQWEMDVWGRLRDQTRANLLQSEATKHQYNAAKLSLSANIARVYFNLLTDKALLELSKRNTFNVERIESISVRSFKRGLVNALDVQLARRDLASSRRSLEVQKNAVENTARQLKVLLGDYPNNLQLNSQSLPSLPSRLDEGVPANVLERRPDLQAAALQILASEQNVKAARKSLFPNIVLNGSAGTSSGIFKNIFDSDFGVWSILGSLSQPLLNRAALKGNLALEKNANERTKLEYIDIVLQAMTEIENALANENSLRAQVNELTIARDYAEKSSNQARQQYEKGLVNANTLLTTERQYLTAEQTLLQTQNQLLQNRVSLYVALGGDTYKLDNTPKGATP